MCSTKWIIDEVHMPFSTNNNSKPSLADTLERIRLTTPPKYGDNKHYWSDILRVTYDKYLKFIIGSEGLSELSLHHLSTHFGLDYNQLIEGQIDFKKISHGSHNSEAFLPEKYARAAFGRRRTTMTSLDFVEQKSGWETRHEILHHLDTDDRLFNDPLAPINIQFISDALIFLAQHKSYNYNDFYQMGAYSLKGNQNTILSETFSRLSHPHEIYDLLFGDMLKYYEQNCHYRALKLTDTFCLAEVKSDTHVADALGVKHLGNVPICGLKAGWMASSVGYLNLPFAKVKKVACVHHGDPSCLYEVNFEEAASYFKNQLN
jgi:hypothetical protein